MSSRDFLTIVSGLPRSGTSMMMRMLEEGGLPALSDGVRTADTDNPKGYYEYEAVKRTREDDTWVDAAIGSVVKMVYQLVYDMPTRHAYRVLCMRRVMPEILASQRRMLERNNMPTDDVSDEQLAALFEKALKDFNDWAQRQSHIELMEVSYNNIQASPADELGRVNEFLGGGLDVAAMVATVDSSLYRNRSS